MAGRGVCFLHFQGLEHHSYLLAGYLQSSGQHEACKQVATVSSCESGGAMQLAFLGYQQVACLKPSFAFSKLHTEIDICIILIR